MYPQMYVRRNEVIIRPSLMNHEGKNSQYLFEYYPHLNYFCSCLLDPTQGYEVRWAIAGKSIVTQLVAKLDDGKFQNLLYKTTQKIPEVFFYLLRAPQFSKS